MKANISSELEELINEKIYLDLEIHILTKKLNKAVQDKDDHLKNYFENRLNAKFKENINVNDQLRKESVKIFDPIIDDIFIQYDFSVKMKNGGYKEGNFRYWKAALKYKLNKRLNNK
jgi:hypothetical protein